MVTLLLALLLAFIVGQVDGMITLPRLPSVRVKAEIGLLRFGFALPRTPPVRVVMAIGRLQFGLATVHRRRAYYRVAFG